MNVLKRAGLYLTRKKARSLILFLILFSMGLFMMAGLAIRRSAAEAADDMRQSISTGLELKMMEISGEKVYDLSYNEDGELVRAQKLDLITESVAEQLASIEGVGGYYSEMGAEMLYTGLELRPAGFHLDLEMMRENGDEDPQRLASDLAWIHSNDYRIVQESQYYPHFSSGAMELVEGRHLHKNDSRKLLVSEQLAEKNGLALGDAIDGQSVDFMTGERYGEVYHAEIVGIFRINFEQQFSEWAAEPTLLENTIFAPFELRYWGQVQYNTHYGNDVLAPESDRLLGSITLFVEDPADLDQVERKVRESGLVDWSYYSISRYDQDYRAAAKPLLTMELFSSVMVAAILIGSLVLLSLILVMWMRGRKQEIHILTSIGMGRRDILAQFLLEISLIAAAAFLAAWALSSPAARVAGDALTEFTNPSEDAEDFTAAYEIESGITYVSRAAVKQAPLSYEVSPGLAALAFLSMMAVSWVVTAIAFLRIQGRVCRPGRIAFLRIRRKTVLSRGVPDGHSWKARGTRRTGRLGAFHRAFLYVTRKTGKSALLFLTLSAMTTLLLFGLSIRQSSEDAAARIRESIGGYFKITPDRSKIDGENQVDQELVDRVMELDGIKASNVMDVCYMDLQELPALPGKFSAEGDDRARMVRVLGNSDTSLHEYFSLEIFSLAEGRHVKEGDTGKAVISQELARQNGLKIGDTFALRTRLEDGTAGSSGETDISGAAGEMDQAGTADASGETDISGAAGEMDQAGAADASGDTGISGAAGEMDQSGTYCLEIVGLFAEEQQGQTAAELTPECDIPGNFIFTDIDTTGQIAADLDPGAKRTYSGGAAFFAADPAKVEQIAEEIGALELFDPGDTKLTVNNAAYQSSMAPLERLRNMSLIMLILIAAAGAVLLTLILTLWGRDRIHEAGALMSFGIPKRNILWQRFLECVSVYLISFAVSTAALLPLNAQIGGWLYETILERTEETEAADMDEIIFAADTVNLELIESGAAFSMELRPVSAAAAGFSGLMLTGLSVTASFAATARRRPKELLAVME